MKIKLQKILKELEELERLSTHLRFYTRSVKDQLTIRSEEDIEIRTKLILKDLKKMSNLIIDLKRDIRKK